jgi:hypothetical protein
VKIYNDLAEGVPVAGLFHPTWRLLARSCPRPARFGLSAELRLRATSAVPGKIMSDRRQGIIIRRPSRTGMMDS